MTREEKLYSMTMKMLAAEAEKLGVKIDKKGSKQKAVEKMLAAEAELKKELLEQSQAVADEEKTLSIPMPMEYTENGPQMIEKTEETPAEVEEQPQKKERKPRKKKEVEKEVSGLLEYIITEWEKMGGIVKMPGKENAVFRPLCVENGRQVIKLMWTTKKISFFVRVEAATAHAEQWQKINYAMPFQCMFFHDTEETRQNIKDIFQLVLDVDSVRPKKEKKTKKQEDKAE